MKFGLFSMNSFVCSSPEVAVGIAQLAEAAGFESLWAGEHVVLPDPQVPPSPAAPSDRFLDPVIALTYLAAHTRQVRLGTGILILPQHNPLVLAKALASLDTLSGGRLIFGIGAGYLEPEFRALGVSFTDRGARTDDYLAAMQAIWTQPQPAYHSRFVSFEHVQAHPQPQRALPVVVGGQSVSAYRRAVKLGTGWYGWSLDLAGTAHALGEIKEVRKQYERPEELGKLEISITPPPGGITLEDAKRYADLGVDRLILLPLKRFSEVKLKEFVSQMGETVLGRL
ncbi:LLM class F420-dependent oxidoreductase [Ktedonospora formicarum]|uniref:LLM class F420-dependent oxidoreductase n=1 Tax=Ktedonospora formicarum TaxID=2778364 RepID=A0A8J3MW68_9CHLR|nr:LLM class F420-dependent oxidoreductase [Ktedonospora formicarum]GHO48373.1 LLM class F420-dependent oxidoreductase [Ktedonospora formicarum]